MSPDYTLEEIKGFHCVELASTYSWYALGIWDVTMRENETELLPRWSGLPKFIVLSWFSPNCFKLLLQFGTISLFHHSEILQKTRRYILSLVFLGHYLLSAPLCWDRFISQGIICLEGGTIYHGHEHVGKTLGRRGLCYSWMLNHEEILYVVLYFIHITSISLHHQNPVLDA